MMTEQLCHKLQTLLTVQAPQIENENDYFRSAVLVPLVEVKGEPAVLFEVRSGKLAWQPGEICFPGGRIEAEDAHPAAAAVRETYEELGLPVNSVELLGPLNYMVSPIGVMMYPFAGYITDLCAIRPNEAEVAEVFTVPLAHLLAAQPLEAEMEMATRPKGDFPLHLLPDSYPRSWKPRSTYPVLFYQYEQYVIWGITARVLYGFLNLCKKIL